MSASKRLMATLRQLVNGRQRASLDDVWTAFHQSMPGYEGDADARPRLAALLQELENGGELAQPKAGKLWDRTTEPPLPLWVKFVAHQTAPSLPQPRDHRNIAWPPAMAFVSDLRQVNNLDELLAVRSFLAQGGAERPLVPIRERSVELFGDEKRLDALVKGALFRPGRLSLELLRCREVAPPLTFEATPGSASSTALILENLHTYDSFRRFNSIARMYGVIAYGHGSEFHATVGDVPRLREEFGVDTVDYFGDLDQRGLEIAVAANERLAAHGIHLTPAIRWYTELLDRAEARQLPGAACDISSQCVAWLPSELQARAKALLAAGYRAPQELVGWELLEQLLPARSHDTGGPA